MVDQERLLNRFVRLASLDTPSLQERPGADAVATLLGDLGIFVEEDTPPPGGNTGTLFARVPGTLSQEPLLFTTHLDTVPPSLGKKIQVGEIICGDGTTILGADNYAAVACLLEALTVLKEENRPHRPLELLFFVAEEIYSLGANQFDFTSVKAKIAITPDYDGPLGGCVQKAPTLLAFTAKVQGKAAHAGFAPELGVSAIAAAARAICAIRQGRVDSETTVNVGQIQGGNATNIVPEHCTVMGEVRSYNHQTALAKMEEIERIFAAEGDCTFTFRTCIRAYDLPTTGSVLSLYHTACQNRGLPFLPAPSFGGSDNNTLNAVGIEGLVIASAMHKCHTTEEYTTQTELVQLAELLVTLMTIEMEKGRG